MSSMSVDSSANLTPKEALMSGLVDTVTDLTVRTNESLTKGLLRKLITGTITAVTCGFVGVIGYSIYRAYTQQHIVDYDPVLQQMLHDEKLEIELRRSKRTPNEIDEIMKRLDEFKLSDETLKQIMEIMDSEMDKGLNSASSDESEVKMIPTYVCHMPSGKESNDILALDLGGSNFRVLFISLRENEPPKILNKVFIVSESIMKGTGEKLFNHIAGCLKMFMKNHNLDLDHPYPLGFTFSFPCTHVGLSEAILIRWTKGFNCSEVIGKNVVAMMQKAIHNLGLKVKVTILINDTVGTLISCAYTDRSTAIGLILGTGTNACYIESVDRIRTLKILPQDGSKEMVVNTEWGAFGECGSIDFIRSRYDEEIDKASINVGKQIFEKMISGMYLGEIVRLMILDLIDSELIFVEEMKKNAYRYPLFTKGSFYTKYLTEIESDSHLKFSKTKRILREVAGIENPSYDDCVLLKYMCHLVTKRSGKLTASGLAVTLKRVNRPEVTVAVDGSLFRYHPRLKLVIESSLKNLVPPNQKFKITLSTDGSGRGAAVVAAVHASYQSS